MQTKFKTMIMKKLVFIIVIFFSYFAYNQEISKDTVFLDEVLIESSRLSLNEKQMLRPIQIIDLQNITISNLGYNELLKFSTGIDIRQRSFASVQSDLSIRGGSFDQSLVLLNGINLSDPQTGHHSLNIPVELLNLQSMEVIYGPFTRTLGTNAMTGAVNFITSKPEKNEAVIDLQYGSFNTLNSGIKISNVIKNFRQSLSFSYSKSDGFIENTDFDKMNFYYENLFPINNIQIKTMLGYTDKNFGAYSFYSPRFKYQYEKIKTGIAAVKLMNSQGNLKWDYKVYYRFLADEFQLFREGENFYVMEDGRWINKLLGDTVTWYQRHNRHFSSVAGTGFNVEKDSRFGKSSLGAEFRHESIYSNVLGLDLQEIKFGLFDKFDYRNNFSIFAEHGYYTKKTLVNLGIMSLYNQKYGINNYYGIDAGYYLTEKFLVKAGFNKSMRVPTYTELYYSDPSNQGNPDLFPEFAYNFEGGVKYFLSKKSYLNVNLYQRYGNNIISWVRENPEQKWIAQNLTRVNTSGVEVFFAYDFKEEFLINKVNIIYSYIYQTKIQNSFESKYAIDHLKHKFVLNINHDLLKYVSGSLDFNIYKRNGEYLPFDFEQNIYLPDAVEFDFVYLLNYRLTTQFKNASIFLSVENILDKKFYDIPNVPVPGIAFISGIKIKI